MKNSWTVILALILTAIIIVAALNLQVFPETIFNKKRLIPLQKPQKYCKTAG
jgi:hypothetical protein